MKNKGTTLTEIIISIMLISVVMIFIFNILLNLKNEDKNSSQNGEESLQRSSYTRLIQNDLINEKLIGISACDDGELCFDLNFENTGSKRFKVEKNAVIYNDEKWEVDSGEFLKNKVQFIYKMATNDEELLKNTNANNYYLLKIVLPDLDKTESNRKIDPEITNIGVGKLNIDCQDIKNKLKNAAYVECDGFEFESEEEVEKNDPHTVRLHLQDKITINTFSGSENNQTGTPKVINATFSNVKIKSGNKETQIYSGYKKDLELLNIPRGATVTISATPSFDDSVGYIYTNSNMNREVRTYFASMDYLQPGGYKLSGTITKNENSYQYTFRMPESDVDINAVLSSTYTSIYQEWYSFKYIYYSFGRSVLCQNGCPGKGPDAGYVFDKNGIKNIDNLAMYGGKTISHTQYYEQDGECPSGDGSDAETITYSIYVYPGGSKYKIYCYFHGNRGEVVQNWHGNWEKIKSSTKEWEETYDSETENRIIQYWKKIE